MFKEWFKILFYKNISDFCNTPTEKWMDKGDPSQVVSSPTINSVVSYLPNLVEVHDSIFNVTVDLKLIISSDYFLSLDFPEHLTTANGFTDFIDSVTLLLEASGYIIN